MRIITLEEHIAFPEMAAQIPPEALGNFGKSPRMQQLTPLLEDITGKRLDSMDRNGITMQVLSVDSANQRTLIETFRQQLFITTSGLFTQPPFKLALETFGLDNIMFSVDYPFSTNEMGKEFLDHTGLSGTDLEKIAYRNAERVLGW